MFLCIQACVFLLSLLVSFFFFVCLFCAVFVAFLFFVFWFFYDFSLLLSLFFGIQPAYFCVSCIWVPLLIIHLKKKNLISAWLNDNKSILKPILSKSLTVT